MFALLGWEVGAVPANSLNRDNPENTFMSTITTAPHVDKESNPWESQRARFDLAAQKLNLDDGLWRGLRFPHRELTASHTVQKEAGHLDLFTPIPVQHP